VIATGAGAEMRKVMGIAVFSGMLGVTFFGLVFTPLFYVLIRGLADRKAPAVSLPTDASPIRADGSSLRRSAPTVGVPRLTVLAPPFGAPHLPPAPSGTVEPRLLPIFPGRVAEFRARSLK